ncbi:YppE family protein [Bacillus litorisediminis]|uniref:YppE family protein n=1 Tax=Bacillus litorisediminis TaxID=2922713 RepID=UPI001FAEAD36|nr:YppE family protein [Bacillus litorisediminis]
MEQILFELTEELLQKNDEIKAIFADVKKENQERDFYQEVKPFADGVKALLDQWEPLSIQWLKQNPVKNLHPQQITHTAENLDMISIQCFFPKTSLTRFRHYAESVEYVLKNLLFAIQNKRE